ncbi:ATP-binding protein [Streptomyces sp. NBC_01803]|uniref:ATP-binding protein n=1 Tax=Streptomyces sp. NBC_01803 TaxID=2975946 RepID=UPI003FA3A729
MHRALISTIRLPTGDTPSRRPRLPEEDIAAWDLPEDPAAAGQAREHIRRQLAAWGLRELEMTTELVASELVGNVIRHAAGPIRLRLLRSTVLTCEVSDGSEATPRIRHTSVLDESGRGLQLVAAMTRRWGARYTQTGKSIWTETAPPPDGLRRRGPGRRPRRAGAGHRLSSRPGERPSPFIVMPASLSGCAGKGRPPPLPSSGAYQHNHHG